MTKQDENRCVRFYHALVAIAILLAGGALIGVGIWLRVTDKAIPELEYTDVGPIDYILKSTWLAIIAGGFLVVTAIVSLFALGKNCFGITFRIIYVFLALIILAVLVFICVMSVLIRQYGNNGDLKEFLNNSWKRTVAEDSKAICDIEERFQCRGFEKDDCVGCPTACLVQTRCASCDNPQPLDVGCYRAIIDRLSHIFLPTAIVSGILSGVVLLDILVTFCL